MGREIRRGWELDRAWLKHSEIAEGGELVFYMGEEPKKWDLGEWPWSLSTSSL